MKSYKDPLFNIQFKRWLEHIKDSKKEDKK